MEFDSDVIGLFQGDLIFKSIVKLIIDDMRKNPYLIEDAFGSLIQNPILSREYGIKEITRAKEFILNNNINIYMSNRMDKMEYPCITIASGSSTEDKSLATLADQSIAFEDFEANEIGQPIKFIVPPFKPVSYDIETGILIVPETIDAYRYVGAGMLLLDPKTGGAFVINGKDGEFGLKINPGSILPSGDLAIIPQFHLYRAKRERAISQESYSIGCHVHGDPSTLIFLFGIIKYGLFRYREGLLEYNNFQLSNLSSSEIVRNESMSEENIFSKWITVTGQCEESWVKTPKRFIEAIDLNDPARLDGVVLQSPIKILSKDAPLSIQEEDNLWITIDDE